MIERDDTKQTTHTIDKGKIKFTAAAPRFFKFVQKDFIFKILNCDQQLKANS
jgi:hypothetical protein